MAWLVGAAAILLVIAWIASVVHHGVGDTFGCIVVFSILFMVLAFFSGGPILAMPIVALVLVPFLMHLPAPTGSKW